MSETKAETWIKAGYNLLGLEGVEGIKIERVARILHLNKSGFYYYFGGMEIYVKRLLQHHFEIATDVGVEITECQSIDPDLLRLIVRRKDFFLVESQLLVKCRALLSHDDVGLASKIVDRELLSLWERNSELPGDSAIALSYLNFIRHFFYARINPDNVSYEFLHALAVETKEVLQRVNH